MRAAPAAPHLASIATTAAAALGLAACTAAPPGPALATDESAVIGGANAPAGKWPDAAAVLFGGQQGCSGVLIAPTVALTAGHCNDADLDSILVGTSSLARPSEGEEIAVARRIEHPSSFDTEDLTVLVLERASRFAPRAIATGWARFDIQNGAQVALVGYGAIDRDANRYINELQEAETAISDADCTQKPGCNASVAPGGELGAGGMGIDTCPGDSGGPLYLLAPYGAFLAGITSRAYDDAQYACQDGGIYARPDKVIDWIEESAGVPVARGPEPAAAAISVVRGGGGETSIAANDPVSEAHTFAIATPPAHGAAKVRGDGRLRVCTDPAYTGDDAVVVTVADKAAPARAIDVRVAIASLDGEPAADCSVDDFEEGGGCCSGSPGAPGAVPLALGVAAMLGRRRRRRR